MKLAKGITLFALAFSAHTAFAADQSVPTDSSLHVKTDPVLKSLVPADLVKRSYIVARTNPNTPPTTFYLKKTTKRWMGCVAMKSATIQVTCLEKANKACEAAGKKPIKVSVFPDCPAGVQTVVSGRVLMFLGPYEDLLWQVKAIKPLTMSGEITVHDAPVSVTFPKDSALEPAV